MILDLWPLKLDKQKKQHQFYSRSEIITGVNLSHKIKIKQSSKKSFIHFDAKNDVFWSSKNGLYIFLNPF